MEKFKIDDIIYLLEKKGVLFSTIKEEDKTIYIWKDYRIIFNETFIDLQGRIPYFFALEIDRTQESILGLIKIIGKKTTSNKIIDNLEFNGNLLAPLDQKIMPLYSPDGIYVSRYYIYSSEAFIMLLNALNDHLKVNTKKLAKQESANYKSSKSVL